MMRIQKLESLGQPGHPAGRDSKDTGLLSEPLGLRCPTHFPTHRRLRSSFISSFRILFSSLSPFISLAAKSVVRLWGRVETRGSHSTREALSLSCSILAHSRQECKTGCRSELWDGVG